MSPMVPSISKRSGAFAHHRPVAAFYLTILFSAFMVVCGSSCASAAERTAGSDAPENQAASEAEERFYMKPFHAIIRQHQEVGTHIDGPRCPMYPSCSAYANRIIREEGVSGLLLFIDRLFYREFGRLSDRYMLAPRRLSKSPRYYDPVSDVIPRLKPDGEEESAPGRRPSFFREDFRQ